MFRKILRKICKPKLTGTVFKTLNLKINTLILKTFISSFFSKSLIIVILKPCEDLVFKRLHYKHYNAYVCCALPEYELCINVLSAVII